LDGRFLKHRHRCDSPESSGSGKIRFKDEILDDGNI
jgi:hypothetical protein